MLTALVRIVLGIIAYLPLSAARGLGVVIGECAWLTGSRGSGTAQTNLAACFPDLSDKSVRQLARKSMHHWGMTLMEVPVVWRQGKRALRWIGDIDGQEYIDNALAQGRGVIFVSPHLGNWEVIGYWLAGLSPVTVMYQPPRRFDVDAILRHVRTKTGAKLVPANVRGVASLIKALKRTEMTGVLPDMEPELGGGVFAPFFGVPALTMTLIHSLQQKSDAVVILGFAQRTKSGFKLTIIKPDDAIYDADAGIAVTALNQSIERLVVQAPEQYQWEYKRFKRRPEGMSKLYKKGQ